jgi:hypothetical protein
MKDNVVFRSSLCLQDFLNFTLKASGNFLIPSTVSIFSGELRGFRENSGSRERPALADKKRVDWNWGSQCATDQGSAGMS